VVALPGIPAEQCCAIANTQLAWVEPARRANFLAGFYKHFIRCGNLRVTTAEGKTSILRALECGQFLAIPAGASDSAAPEYRSSPSSVCGVQMFTPGDNGDIRRPRFLSGGCPALMRP
jgi:hypothetical protein